MELEHLRQVLPKANEQEDTLLSLQLSNSWDRNLQKVSHVPQRKHVNVFTAISFVIEKNGRK